MKNFKERFLTKFMLLHILRRLLRLVTDTIYVFIILAGSCVLGYLFFLFLRNPHV